MPVRQRTCIFLRHNTPTSVTESGGSIRTHEDGEQLQHRISQVVVTNKIIAKANSAAQESTPMHTERMVTPLGNAHWLRRPSCERCHSHSKKLHALCPTDNILNSISIRSGKMGDKYVGDELGHCAVDSDCTMTLLV